MEPSVKVSEDMFRQTTESPSHFLMTLVIMDGKLLSFLAMFFPAFFMLYLAHGSPDEGGGSAQARKEQGAPYSFSSAYM